MRTFRFKKSTLAILSVAIMSLSLAPMAEAQTTADYDGYCYMKKDNSARDAALFGAAAGAIAGSLFSKKKKKVKGAVLGAAVGGVAGYVVGKSNKKDIKCWGNRYYVFNHGYYDPIPAEEKFNLIFFTDRPDSVELYVRQGGEELPYKGH